MNKYKVFRTSVLLLLVAGLVFASDSKKNIILSRIIYKNLNHMHYSPPVINDAFSVEAFDMFLKRMDHTKRFLTTEDVARLKQFRTQVDDEFKTSSLTLQTRAFDLLKKRVEEAEVMVSEITSRPFDFSKEEFLEMDSDKRKYCSSVDELRDRWRKIIKYQTLLRYFTLAEEKAAADSAAGKPSDANIFRPLDAGLEKEARDRVARSALRNLKRLSERKDEDRLSMYINALAGSYDPHTVYFPPERKEDFDIEMTGRLEGIGAVLQEEDGYIKVVRIIPGSASWRQKELKAEDVILKVAQGDGEPEDIVDMPLRDAVRLIRGPKGTEVRLTVKKPGGRVQVVPIIRDVVVIEEAYARSIRVRHHAGGRHYGYLYLPKFYRDFKHSGARNSTDDVEKELEKLKSEGVDGLVLDLRNNGGGSLLDAVGIAGLFFAKGPVVQVRDRNASGDVLRDNDPAVVYDGPVVVLMNANSASASEIVAAALQDYKRAVIVGSPHSFGKGTVQTMVDLDRFLYFEYHHLKPLGSLKVTIQKFYRINGGTTQYEGVVSDIVLPDPYSSLETGEKYLDHPLPWDTVKPLTYRTWNEPPPDLAELKVKSAARVADNRAFSIIRDNIGRLKKRREDSLQPLQFKAAWEDQKSYKEESQEFKDIQKETVKIDLFPLAADMADLEKYPDKKDRIGEWHDQVKSDVYLEEAMMILDDMIGKK